MKIPLLLSLHLHLLPLEALRPCWSEPGLYVVMQDDRVVLPSPQAWHAGVRHGMRSGGVAAVAPTAILLERAPEREAAALEAIALALLQYTPQVAFAVDYGVTLDVGASLRLFGGPLALCRRVRTSMRTLGYSAVLAAAPTAQGAWLLAHTPDGARQQLHRRSLRLSTLGARLDRLPCAVLPAAVPFLYWLRGIGAADLQALRRLPRAGLLRRTSKQLLRALDTAYGDDQEMLQWMAIPSTFAAYAETLGRIDRAEHLMVGATGLVLQLTGWLSARQLAVQTFTLQMEHERGRAAVPPTPWEITLAEPAWKEAHLLRLLKERLAKIELHAPVIGLRLLAGQLVAMAPPTDQLFPEPGGTPADYKRLLELLTARLGADNVLTPASSADIRPEHCNGWMPASSSAGADHEADEFLVRPCLVLPTPIALIMRDERPQYEGALKLIRGPERLEAGWWDDQFIGRDYYVAQGPDAACYWIYRERSDSPRWCLHGLFA